MRQKVSEADSLSGERMGLIASESNAASDSEAPAAGEAVASPEDVHGEERAMSRIDELAKEFASTAPSAEIRNVRYRQRRVRLLIQRAQLEREQQDISAQRASRLRQKASG